MADITPPVIATPIEVNGRTIDPQDHYARDAQHTDHIVIGVKDVLSIEQRAKLEALQVEFLEDLGSNNLLCRYTPTDLSPLRDPDLDFVRQVDVYRNLFKIPEELQFLVDHIKDESVSAAAATCPVDVMVHQHVSDIEALADAIAKTAHVEREKLDVRADAIRLEAPIGRLEAIAADDRVRILEEVVTPTLYDGQAQQIVCAPVQMPGATDFQGKDQVIAVADTGFDLGTIDNCHPAFTGRIKRLIPLGRASDSKKSDAQKVDDPQGHGTHVCGTIVGQEIETSQGFIGGVAPDAKLVVSSLLASNGDLMCVKDVRDVFLSSYMEDDARVHSNSWGDKLGNYVPQRPYREAARCIDDFVRLNPDALVCFSAGNNNETMLELDPKGVPKQSIGSQAAAKNCLTVGASGSTRMLRDSTNVQIQGIHPDMMCPDSSRGPTAEKRIKPDVVAPGFNIFSAYSRHPAVKYQAAEAKSDSYPSVMWKVRSGTSHSTPLVAGCAAVLREILQSKGCQRPPAALLKAVIINGADKLPGVDIEAQGFGRVNLQASAAMLEASPILAKDISPSMSLPSLGGTLIGDPLRQGEELSFTLAPPQVSGQTQEGSLGEPQLKITMIYNDLPGGQIQNNLNLAVIDPGTGNIQHGGISEDQEDVQNNVEQVVWSPMPQSPLTIRVRAHKLVKTDSEQDFALAWSVQLPYSGYKEAST